MNNFVLWTLKSILHYWASVIGILINWTLPFPTLQHNCNIVCAIKKIVNILDNVAVWFNKHLYV